MEISEEKLNLARELMTEALRRHEEGDVSRAEELYLLTLEAVPEFTLAHFNLGRIYYGQGNFDQAAFHYKEAAGQQPGDTDILFNLALTLKKSGRLDEAEALYSQALELFPQDPELHYNLALTRQARHKYDEAIESYREAIALKPDYGPAHNNLGFVLHRQGRLAEAAEVYRKLIALEHNTISARHMLAALEGKTTKTAPQEYVRKIFDNYSANYEYSLVNELGYETPNLLRGLLPAVAAEAPPAFADCLDLGCGTGLSGAAFADLCRRITGVDLSSGMLKTAAEKNIYHALYQGEIVEFLDASEDNFDLFLATDVFVYLGDLSPVFQAVKKRAPSGAMFLFSTEKTDGSGYILQPSGRYAHTVGYIETLSRDYGFKLTRQQETKIRKERGEWIRGNLFLLRSE